MLATVAPSPLRAVLPGTEDAIEFLEHLRRELRFDEQFEGYVNEGLLFAVRGINAPKGQRNPSPGTACWSFRGVPGRHMIHFCLKALEKMRAGGDWRGYLACYAHHEFLHACLTLRDLRRMSKILDKEGIPFRLWNLFEDARIESFGRSKFGFPLNWLDYEDMIPAKNPQAYYFNLIQNCGVDNEDLLTEGAQSEAWVARVRDHYYARTIAAKSSEALLPLMKEWIVEFGKPSESKLLMDLEFSTELSNEDFKALCELALEQSAHDQGSGLPREEVEEDSILSEPDTTNHPIIADVPIRTLDHSTATRVADRLSSLLAPRESKERTSHPSKRLSARAYLMGRNDFYRRRTNPIGGGKGREVSVACFIDCSGSMADVIDTGIAIAMGFNLMARRGLVSGHIVLHQIAGRTSRCASYKLPLPDRFFERIPADGNGEGLAPAFKKALRLLQEADYTFCYTDGQISDAPIDKRWLASHNVRPIGLYCGEEEMAPKLANWFSCSLIRESALDLLEAIVATVDFKRHARR